MFLLVLLFNFLSCTALSYNRPLTQWFGVDLLQKALPVQTEYG